LVGPRHVITAGHNIWGAVSKKLFAGTVKLGQKGAAGLVRSAPQGVVSLVYTLIGGVESDFGMYFLDDIPGPTSWLGLGYSAGNWLLGQKVALYGYPASYCACKDAPDKVFDKVYKAPLGQCADYLYGEDRLVVLIDPGVFASVGASQEEMSGAPYFVGGTQDPAVVGVHSQGASNVGNAKSFDVADFMKICGWIGAVKSQYYSHDFCDQVCAAMPWLCNTSG